MKTILRSLPAVFIAASFVGAAPAWGAETGTRKAPLDTKLRPATDIPLNTPAARGENGTCTVDSIDPASNQRIAYTVHLPIPGSRQRIASCLLSAKQAVQRAAKGDLILVDVRPADAFERYRIAGSLNAHLAFIKTKSFLKPRAFALVNEGRQTAELEAACQALRAEGFAGVTVVQGGLGAWRKAHGRLEGDALAQRDLSRMRNAELAQEGNYNDWVVISVASATAKEVQAFLPRAIAMTASDDKRLARAVKAAVAKRGRQGLDLKVLIVDNDGSHYDRIEKALSGAVTQNVYFLEDGLSGYRKFWSEQATIWATAGRPPRKTMCGA